MPKTPSFSSVRLMASFDDTHWRATHQDVELSLQTDYFVYSQIKQTLFTESYPSGDVDFIEICRSDTHISLDLTPYVLIELVDCGSYQIFA